MKRRLAVMQMRRWDWALQPRTLTFLINDGAVPKQWQLTDTVRLWSRVHTSHSHAGSYHAHASLCLSSCLLFSSDRTPVGWFGSNSDHLHAIKETALESIWDCTSECNYCVHTGPNKKHWGGIWCIDMVMMTLTLKMCCTETGDAAITSSFHKLTAAQSPHTQKLSDGHVSPWNVFFYCTCHESVDVDKDTWIAQCKNKQMFEAVNKTPA